MEKSLRATSTQTESERTDRVQLSRQPASQAGMKSPANEREKQLIETAPSEERRHLQKAHTKSGRGKREAENLGLSEAADAKQKAKQKGVKAAQKQRERH